MCGEIRYEGGERYPVTPGAMELKSRTVSELGLGIIIPSRTNPTLLMIIDRHKGFA
jgi:hypothetical protein